MFDALYAGYKAAKKQSISVTNIMANTSLKLIIIGNFEKK